MEKAILLISLLICINLVILLLLPQTTPFKKKQEITIALAGPMSGKDRSQGEAMLQGARLCLDNLEKNGRLKNKEIKLLILDDKNDRATAQKIATQLTEDNEALLVLGHYYSTSSGIAGAIYKKNGIPAITASETADPVFSDNDWYFRVTQSNRFVSEFVAEYIKRGLNRSSASIIFDDSQYGRSLMENFEKKARQLGIAVNGKWTLNSEGKNVEDQLAHITARLRSMDDPGVVYCATDAPEGAKILAGLSYPDAPFTVIGPESFSLPAFIENLTVYPNEKKFSGYHSNGVNTIVPYLADVGGKRAYDFKEEFVRKYKTAPTWVAACYHDAMLVAVSAIERGEITGLSMREARRRIRMTLAGFNSPKTAIDGVTASIYFDSDGSLPTTPLVGFYDSQRLLPAYRQFKDISETPLKSSVGIRPAVSENRKMTDTRVIYVGSTLFELCSLDIKQGRFTADFLIWFRFKDEFDAQSIRFTNAVKPIRFTEPVLEAECADSRMRAYRVKAQFMCDIDDRRYPFDHQTLDIRLRHDYITADRLVFVSDKFGIPGAVSEKQDIDTVVNMLHGWKIRKLYRYQDIESIPSESEKQIADYSRLSTSIRIVRNAWGYNTSVFLPVIVMVLILYFLYGIPPDRIRMRLLLVAAVSVVNTVYYVTFRPAFFPGCLDIVYMAIYALAAVGTGVSGIVYRLEKNGRFERQRMVQRAAKIFHSAAVVAAGIWSSYIYIG